MNARLPARAQRFHLLNASLSLTLPKTVVCLGGSGSQLRQVMNTSVGADDAVAPPCSLTVACAPVNF